MNPTHIDTLLQMTIGQIKDSEKARKHSNDKWADINQRQKETVASAIEQNDLTKKKWAADFLEELEDE